MGIKVGETATITAFMDVEYRCSSCGKKNSQTLPLKGVGHVGTVFGYNLGDPVREAKENALGKLRVLQSDQPNKYLITPISCVCERCGYREPWASLDHTRLGLGSHSYPRSCSCLR